SLPQLTETNPTRERGIPRPVLAGHKPPASRPSATASRSSRATSHEPQATMKIFATGHRGYIGAHLVEVLKQEGHTVIGCDLGLFDGCQWGRPLAPDREVVQDVRRVEVRDLDGCDCVMHLAALSNDPMGAMDARTTFAVNRDASIRLAGLAKRAGVPRFLLAGSCSVYGQGEKL